MIITNIRKTYISSKTPTLCTTKYLFYHVVCNKFKGWKYHSHDGATVYSAYL